MEKLIKSKLLEGFLRDIGDISLDDNFKLLKKEITALNYQNIQMLIDSLPDYIILVDSKHNIIMANSLIKSMGYSSEELLGSYCPRIFHNSDSPIPECPLEKAVECNSSTEIEFYDQSIDRWFLSSVYITPFLTQEGDEIYFHQLRDITERKKSKEELADSIEQLNNILEQGIQAIVKLVEKRDPYTAGHQKNVSHIAKQIAIRMGLSKEMIETVTFAGLLHDIGKITVPIDILNKPTVLNEHEFNLIKLHPVEGYDILKDIDFTYPIAETILQHHERLDGSGYPDGLSQDEISQEARILAVADVVDAISSHRPYRPALGVEIAIKELLNNKEKIYDAQVVDTCIELLKGELSDMYKGNS